MSPHAGWIREDATDGTSEWLAIVETDAGERLVQICTGPETGDDFVGLYYYLDGHQADCGGWTEFELVEPTPEEIDEIETSWESGRTSIVRLTDQITSDLQKTV